MDSEAPNTPRQLLESLLDQGMVMVTLDARRDEVQVPAQFASDPQLRLNLSYRFGLPIELDDFGIRARLTFSGVPFDCALPWDAIYMVVSHVTGQPLLFPENVPQELMQLASQMRARASSPDDGKARPQLKVVAESDDAIDDASPTPTPSPDTAETTSVADDVVSSQSQPPASDEGATAPAADEAPPPRTPPRRGHLRVIK